MRFTYDAEACEVEKELAKVEALRRIAIQLERIGDALDDDDSLVTDGGFDERRTTREDRRDSRPPFVDRTAGYAVCHFCGQTWEPAVVDGFDLSSDYEYHPKMVPVCPEHAGGCR